MAEGLLANLFSGGSESENNVINLLFETKDLAKQSMTTRLPPSLVWDMSIVELIQETFKSKVLGRMRTALYKHKVSEDGEGRLELSEAALAMRRSSISPED